MRVGYARVSSRDQQIDAQLGRLGDCEQIFHEKESGARTARPQLDACLEFVRRGDTLVTTRLDRLARSVTHLCLIAETLERKGVALVVLDQAIDTGSPTGKLLFHLLAAIAEFELGIRKEQQRAGIAHARASGKRTGRPPRLNGEDQAKAVALVRGGHSPRAVGHRFGVDESTIRRYVGAASSFAAS